MTTRKQERTPRTYRAISILFCATLAALFLASLAACNTGPASVTPAPATTSVPSDRQLLATYSRMNDRYLALWTRGGGTRTASAHTRTIMGFPHLVLEARGRGAKPDFYVYLPSPDGGQTQEFGAFFDRNGDGRIDWLVFNGGTLLAAGPTIAWWTHHVIDRNGDGRERQAQQQSREGGSVSKVP